MLGADQMETQRRDATGLLSACADSPVTADMNMPLYYTKHKEKPTDITVWKILSFHCQIQLNAQGTNST